MADNQLSTLPPLMCGMNSEPSFSGPQLSHEQNGHQRPGDWAPRVWSSANCAMGRQQDPPWRQGSLFPLAEKDGENQNQESMVKEQPGTPNWIMNST